MTVVEHLFSIVIWSHPRNRLSELAFCVVDMSPQRVPARGVERKSGSDKGICAGHVGDTAPDNVSTPQFESHVSNREDTPKRTPDNR